MKEGYFITRTYKAGKVCEKIKYWVSGKRPAKAGRATSAEIKKQEQGNERFGRTSAFNGNFSSLRFPVTGRIIYGTSARSE